MLERKQMHPYQDRSVQFLMERDAAALWLDMGLGKTVSTLTAIVHKLSFGEADAFIVVSTSRVIQTVWRQEAAKWKHTKGLRFSLVHGNERTRADALRVKADIYLISYDNLQWLERMYRVMPGFPKGVLGIIYDESSKMKSPKTKRFKSMTRMRPRFQFHWQLTGTPAPNSYLDVWAQIFLLDGGRRFGDRFDLFRNEFFKKENEYAEHSAYSIRMGSQRRIERAISPIVLRLDARDYKQMPAVTRNDIIMDMPPAVYDQYRELENEFFLQLEEGEIEAFNASALSSKLWQFANGAIYDAERNWHAVHNAKLDALDDILEEAGGEPVLIAYWFRSDLARLKAHYGNDIPVFTECKNPDSMIQRWKRKEMPFMLIHPQSGSHGVDGLQHGGHILAMFSQTWSLEMHDQLVARLNRQGQDHPVIVHYLMMRRTVDEAIRDAIETKSRTQSQLLDALRRYRLRETLLA